MKFDSISELLERYYAEKNTVSRIHQKSTDLRKIISNALERSVRKLDLQTKQLKDTEKREKYRIYGELLNTYGYGLSGGEKSLKCLNYYDNTEITIPLDPTMTAQENAKRYFDKYNEQKRTYEAVTEQLAQTKAEIDQMCIRDSPLQERLREGVLSVSCASFCRPEAWTEQRSGMWMLRRRQDDRSGQ